MRVAWISTYGVACFVRSEGFIEAILDDIGKVVNPQSINIKPNIMDVLNLMIYTDSLDQIRNRIKACVDGIWFNLLVIEDVTLHKEEESRSASTTSNGEVSESFMGVSDSNDEPPKTCPVLSPKLNQNQERPPQVHLCHNPNLSREAKRHPGGDVDVSAKT